MTADLTLKNMAAIDAALSALDISMTNQEATLNDMLLLQQGLTTLLTDETTRAAVLDELNVALQAELDLINAQRAIITARIRSLEKEVDDARTNVDGTQASVRELQARLAATERELEGSRAEVRGQEQRWTGLQPRLEQQAASIRQASARVEKGRTTLAAQQQAVLTTATKLADLKRKRDDAVEELQNKRARLSEARGALEQLSRSEAALVQGAQPIVQAATGQAGPPPDQSVAPKKLTLPETRARIPTNVQFIRDRLRDAVVRNDIDAYEQAYLAAQLVGADAGNYAEKFKELWRKRGFPDNPDFGRGNASNAITTLINEQAKDLYDHNVFPPPATIRATGAFSQRGGRARSSKPKRRLAPKRSGTKPRARQTVW
jgi:peptidoglycan hydrolase CwlO-like protein